MTRLRTSPWRQTVMNCQCLASGLVILAASATAQSLPGWNLVWSDEFAGPNIDMSKWSYEVNGQGGGNNELQYYTDRSTNSFIQDGKLVIQALQETYTGPDGTRNYTSARMRTKYKGDWEYGRFEARMKLPYGKGLWPAYWMLPTDSPYGGWAASGEIDIMEIVGHEPNKLYGTIHYHGEWPNNWSSGGSYTLSSGDFSDDFHVFALEWGAGIMRWYMDGINFSTKTSWDTTSGAPFPAPFDVPFHILLNVAVGGNWPGNPDATTVFPQQMVVDYVRVYSVSNAPPTNSGVLLNPGFETGALSPWVGNGAGANGNGGTVLDLNGLVYDHSIGGPNTQGIKHPTFGNYSCKAYGAYSGSPNSTGFYQDVAAVPGSVWSATMKARTEYPDRLTANSTAVVEVSFRDAGNSVLAKYTSQTFDTSKPTNTWVDMNVTHQVVPVNTTTNKLHAPANTVKARFEVVFSQVLYDLGSIYSDDAQLQQVLLEPVTITPSVNGGNIELSFPTDALLNYRVLHKVNMTDPGWTLLTTVAGDGTTKTVSDLMGTASCLYRVETTY